MFKTISRFIKHINWPPTVSRVPKNKIRISVIILCVKCEYINWRTWRLVQVAIVDQEISLHDVEFRN